MNFLKIYVYGKRCQKSKVDTFLEIKIKLTHGNFSVLKILDLENNMWNRVVQSIICPVKITLRTSLVTPVRFFVSFSLIKSHSNVNLFCLLVWFTFFISTIFFKLALRNPGAEMRQSNNLSFNLKNQKCNSWTLFKACTFYFHTKLLSNKV